MNRLFLILALISGLAVVISTRSFSEDLIEVSQAIDPCLMTEQEGCLEVDIFVYQYDPNNRLIQDLVKGEKESRQGVAKLLFEQYLAGGVKLAPCMETNIFMWGKSDVHDSSMREYSGRDVRHPDSGPVSRVVSSLGFPLSDGIPAGRAYTAQTCGWVVFQAPYEFWEDVSSALVCINGDLLYPYKRRNQFGQGLKIARSIREALKGGQEYLMLAFVAE